MSSPYQGDRRRGGGASEEPGDRHAAKKTTQEKIPRTLSCVLHSVFLQGGVNQSTQDTGAIERLFPLAPSIHSGVTRCEGRLREGTRAPLQALRNFSDAEETRACMQRVYAGVSTTRVARAAEQRPCMQI